MASTALAKRRSVGLIPKKAVPVSKAFFEKQEKKRLSKKRNSNKKKKEEKTRQMSILSFLTKGKSEMINLCFL